HSDESAGGISSRAPPRLARPSGENVIRHAFLVFSRVEALRLQLEHGAVTSAERHQLLVTAQLDDAPMLEDADAVRMAHGREAVRDENGGGVAGGIQDAVEDLGLAAHIELRRGLIE